MKDNNLTYEQLIARIKNAKPSIDNPQQMTDNIMLAVANLPRRSRVGLTMKIITAVSSAAAVVLVGLFIAQYEVSTAPDLQSVTAPIAQRCEMIGITPDKGRLIDQINELVIEKQTQTRQREALRTAIVGGK